MSSTRWESSQRPLFVKSVWMNGYRHAILTKEDPVAKRKPSSNRLRSSKQNSARSKLKSSDSTESSSLVIPAVQLLLADVQRLNRTENEKQYPERKKFVKSITFNVMSREYSPMHVKNFDLDDLTPSSKHIALSYNLNNNSGNKIQVIERIKSERMEQSSSSLTERVLLWLDLAGRFSNEYSSYNNNNNIEDDNKKSRNIRIRENKRISTAYPSYSEKTAQFSAVNHDNVFVRKCTKNTQYNFIASNHDSNIDLSLEFQNENENEDDYSILKEPRKVQMQMRNNEQNNAVQPEQIVTSHIEDVSSNNCKSNDTDNEQLNKNFSQELSKRQVHIFMPIMKNKNIENNSVLSCSTNTSI